MVAIDVVKHSARILASQPKLLWFNVLAIMAIVGSLIINGIVFLILLLIRNSLMERNGQSLVIDNIFGGLVVLLIVSAISFAIVMTNLCRAGLIVEVNKVLYNAEYTVSIGEGIAVASRRFYAIAGWSAIQATVEIIVRFLKKRVPFFSYLVNIAWDVASYVAFPCLVLEQKGPIEALKYSSNSLKARWGTNLNLNAGVALIALAGFLIIGLTSGGIVWFARQNGYEGLTLATGIIGSILFAVVIFFTSVLSIIVRTAFYRLLKNEEISSEYDSRVFHNMVTSQ